MVNDQIKACNPCLIAQFIQGTNVHCKSYLRHLQNSYLDGMIYTLLQYMKPTILYKGGKKSNHIISMKRMGCHSPRTANQKEIYPISVVIAVARWGIMPTHRNAPTTALRSPTKVMKIKNHLELASITRRK